MVLLPQRQSAGGPSLVATLASIAWRNLWRNKRRTWLTIGGIAFAVWFLVFARSMQTGTFELMIDNGAHMLPGQWQIQHPDYADDPRVDLLLDTEAALAQVRELPGPVQVSARAQGFALVSSGERSYGAQIIGVQPEVEVQWSALAALTQQGRYLTERGEAFVGATLAKNLQLHVGDELAILGTARAGGIAALSTQIVGIFSTGSPELDRALVKVHLADFREAWHLADHEGHAVVGLSENIGTSEVHAARLRQMITANRVLSWQDLMAEAEQMRDMKAVSTEIFFYVITLIVGFSIVNTFMMLIYERTPELGVLMAIGMRVRHLQWLLQFEAACIAVLGIGIGFGLAEVLMFAVADTGIPLPTPGEAEALLARFNMSDRIYPSFDWDAFVTASLVMLVGVQLAAFVPGLRLRSFAPVVAIRQQT